MNVINISGRKFVIEQIAYALSFPGQIVVYPVSHFPVTLTHTDAQRMDEALKAGGFVGEGTLINPGKVTVMEDQGTIFRIYLDGIANPISVPTETITAMFPAQEAVTPAPAQSGKHKAKKEAA